VKYDSSVTNSSQDNEQKIVLTIFTKVTLVTLTFVLVNPKGPHQTILHVKYESSVINSFQDNGWKTFGLPTDGQTDGLTD